MVDELVVGINCLLELIRIELSFLETFVWLYVHDLFDFAVLPLGVKEKVHDLAFKESFVIDLVLSQRVDLAHFSKGFMKFAFLNAQFFVKQLNHRNC